MKKETFLQKLRRWYTEGLTGQLAPDYAKIAKLRKKDLKRLEQIINKYAR